MKKYILLLVVALSCFSTIKAQPIYNENGVRLYHHLSDEEAELYKNIDMRLLPSPPPSGELRPIAEYEPAESVIIRYPFGIPMSLIKEMAENTKVITIVANNNEKTTVTNQYTANGVNMSNCEFLITATNSYWTRDYGPWFMAIDNNHVAMYDFTYNRPRPNDNNVNSVLATALEMERYASSIQHCGGNFMDDGVSQAVSTTLTLTENPSYSLQQLQDHFRQYMGIETYHFVNDPLQDYIKHIDCWGKFLSPNKVMIGQVPASDSRYALFEAAAAYFENLTSSWGMPFQVFRVFTPGAQGYGPATPYTNSLILNKKVFVALTGNSNDAAAIQAYQQAMPGYEIIGINYNDWIDTDALHCRTHEIADRCMLYIKHAPFFGELENTGTIDFNTEVYSYCNNEIYSDSVILYLKIDGGEYHAYNMLFTDNNNWTASLNDLPSDVLIEYYIFAADLSGKRECHPYIGAPDPHKFYLYQHNTPPHIVLSKPNSTIIEDEPKIVEDQIVISNLGNSDLTFNINNINFLNILTISPIQSTINPGSSSTLSLTFDLTSLNNGVYSGDFTITSNDPDNSEIVVPIEITYNYLSVSNTNNNVVYPNPSSGKINIVSSQSQNATLVNVLGNPVMQYSLHSGINTFDVAFLPDGVYFVLIDNSVHKFIIIK